ncbi:MAG: AI-2E family transporter [Saprospiraceae bacterium]|nr:AI-2E family transporter [Bacteroidia bacterium]NNE14611.1 AI-2E family transporter [Saprospiraceae bacterium]NNL92514.1 AI-2E family transporter [Saprospiraceae bacterium]
MKEQPLLAKISQSLFILISVGWLLHIGSSIILPIIFAGMLSVFLLPLEKRVRNAVKIKAVSIIISFVACLIPLFILSFLFSLQLMSILESLPSIGKNLEQGLNRLIHNLAHLVPGFSPESLLDPENQSLDGPLSFISKGFVSTTTFLTSFGLTFLYAFFILYYRVNIKNFIIYQFAKKTRPEIRQTLTQIKETIQAYLSGVGIVVIILAILNSIGLSIIGIKYAIFWGTFAGILAVIPYVGTLIGGILPFLFALSTADANWQPIAVVVYYVFIQQIEGNLITPKIVGNKVDINPMFAILAIVLFGTFWGVAGIILALPIISILKIFLENFDNTKPYALLMSTEIDGGSKSFEDK